jgi:hypothetical protein
MLGRPPEVCYTLCVTTLLVHKRNKMTVKERQAVKQLEDAVVYMIEVHEGMLEDMMTPAKNIEACLPQILKRAKKRYVKEREAQILWETPSIP